MNSKNQWWRYCVIGAALLLVVGIGAFCFLHFSNEPVITGDLASEELARFEAAVRHWQVIKFKSALRKRKWQKLPTLAVDCLRRPSLEVLVVDSSDKNQYLVKAKGRKGTPANSYLFVKSGTNWMLRAEATAKPSQTPGPQ
jgi:hypothetical protein